MIYRRSFGEVKRSVPQARHFAESTLHGMPSQFVDSVVLMVSELATNAIQHATSPFEVVIDRKEDGVVVEVSDNGSGTASPRKALTTDPSGRGLQIVGALADSWGVRPSTPKWTKTIWFSLNLSKVGGSAL